MKKILLPVFICSALAFMAFNFEGALPIGSPMPMADAKLKDISGKEVSMKEAKKDNGILVMFSCNTCPYVIKNQERTLEVARYAQKMNIGVILLNSNEALRGDEDSYDAMKAYAQEQQYQWNYVVDKDHKVADAFGANRTPECFLFDKDLKLVYHGAIDDNPSDASAVSRKHLVQAIDEMTAGKNISVKESRSVGCTIKRIK
ncbi:MAG: thioredoxin family protein [Chitinophagaceae bacterium]|nr:thioredoxin family protein [Chitinophagaceae bacterium]MBL0056317.1 thioredoxin family protein [Chitinophagaceae bacterium]